VNRILPLFLLVVVFSVMHGCDSGDRRLAELANEASRRQAEQNVEMAQLNREVAANNRRVVESSDNITSLQRELQTERRDLANQHRHESLLAPIVGTIGGVLVCLLPLLVCLRLFRTLGDESTDAGMVELLMDETLALPPPSTPEDHHPLLPPSRRPALVQDAVESSDAESEARAEEPDSPGGIDRTDDEDYRDEGDYEDDAIDRPF